MREALEWIYAEPEDTMKVQSRAKAALDAVRGAEPLHQWLMRVVGSASTTPSAKRTVEAALDAVRGSAARNQEDEVNRLANDLAGDWRERAERAEAFVTMWKTRLVEETGRLRELLAAARSPQSEDHEA